MTPQNWRLKKVARFFRKNKGVTPSVAAPGITNPSDAAGQGLGVLTLDDFVLLVEVYCSPLPAAAADADAANINAVIDADNCSLSRQVLGTECHVTCLPGFQLRHRDVNYTCLYDGRAYWYPTTPPVCYGINRVLIGLLSA